MNVKKPRNHQIRTPVIYVLSKVHKRLPLRRKFAGCLIISDNGHLTDKIFEFVDCFLLIPIAARQNKKPNVKDTCHILEIL